MANVLRDSGPLIALAKLNRQQLLIDLWPTVQITEAVYQETVVLGQARGAPDGLVPAPLLATTPLADRTRTP